ncbi:hypothetical protein CK203_023245 [Vitis vinifera]|uniref:Uncharacterized protein n=1 Tax=Vitis vinifera TaxID=29760 RepID=A0A438J1L6_VITVI|nr:hypothetical protein CK203_023245 [Vitis vinifera]
MELELKIELKICVYRWSIDLVIVWFYLVSFIQFVCIVGSQFRSWLSLKSHSWKRVGGRLIRVDSHQSSDSSIEMLDELASALASIQEFIVRVSRRLDQIESSCQDHHPVGMVTNEQCFQNRIGH